MTLAALIACALFTLINVLDFVSTYSILHAGGVELNPVVRWLMQALGRALGLLVAKLAAVGAVWGAWYAGAFAHLYLLAPLGLLTVVYAAVVLNNFKELRKQKGE